jgi:hypothetical protein
MTQWHIHIRKFAISFFPCLFFFFIVSLAWKLGTIIDWAECKLNIISQPYTPPIIPLIDSFSFGGVGLYLFYVAYYMLMWAILPFFIYFLFPEVNWYATIKKTLHIATIALIIYIFYPAWAYKLAAFAPGESASYFCECPSFHVIDTMILFLTIVLRKKDNFTPILINNTATKKKLLANSRLIILIYISVSFAGVIALPTITNSHYFIDVIVSLFIVSIVWWINAWFDHEESGNVFRIFFEISLPRKFHLLEESKNYKYETLYLLIGITMLVAYCLFHSFAVFRI